MTTDICIMLPSRRTAIMARRRTENLITSVLPISLSAHATDSSRKSFRGDETHQLGRNPALVSAAPMAPAGAWRVCR